MTEDERHMNDLKARLAVLESKQDALAASLETFQGTVDTISRSARWILVSALSITVTLIGTGFRLTWSAAQVDAKVGNIQDTIEKFGDISEMRALVNTNAHEIEKLREKVELNRRSLR